MRAIKLERFGIENLRVVEVDDPEPASGQVLVKFGAASVKALGANVIITSASDEKLARATALGADSATTPTRGDTARGLTGGRGVDAVVEIGSTGTLEQSIAAIHRGGHFGKLTIKI